MTLTSKHQQKTNRPNKVYVCTKYSSDGRSLEGFWLSYDPKDGYALFLLEQTLNTSGMVSYYSVYDENSNVVKSNTPAVHPKRI